MTLSLPFLKSKSSSGSGSPPPSHAPISFGGFVPFLSGEKFLARAPPLAQKKSDEEKEEADAEEQAKQLREWSDTRQRYHASLLISDWEQEKAVERRGLQRAGVSWEYVDWELDVFFAVMAGEERRERSERGWGEGAARSVLKSERLPSYEDVVATVLEEKGAMGGGVFEKGLKAGVRWVDRKIDEEVMRRFGGLWGKKGSGKAEVQVKDLVADVGVVDSPPDYDSVVAPELRADETNLEAVESITEAMDTDKLPDYASVMAEKQKELPVKVAPKRPKPRGVRWADENAEKAPVNVEVLEFEADLPVDRVSSIARKLVSKEGAKLKGAGGARVQGAVVGRGRA